MKAIEMPAREACAHPGLVLCHNVFDPEQPRKVLLRKGRVLSPKDREVLEILDGAPLHLLVLGPDDVAEDEAGERLALAAAGPGVRVGASAESQVRLEAADRGLLRIHQSRLSQVNALDGITVWTLEDLTPVEVGRHVASAKVAPLAVPASVLEEAEAASHAGLLRVAPYMDRQIAVLVREKLAGKARERFEVGIRGKTGWFGAPPPGVAYVGTGVEPTAEALRAFVDGGAELVLVGGTSATDPLDPMFEAISREGGRVLKLGVPAHPGSTYWLAELGATPILGLASCGMFSQMTALDLLLPRFFSGEDINAPALESLAVGGLIGKDRTYRFPQYGGEPG